VEITLGQLLESRDNRRKLQGELLGQYPQCSLLCLTVVMPGKVKRNESSLIVAKAAVKAVTAAFEGNITDSIERDLPTGYEYFLITAINEKEAKEIACDIEEKHPLGRLFDIDIIGHDLVPIERSAVGRPPRQCLLCDHEARYCMRNHSHTADEIAEKIKSMIAEYLKNQEKKETDVRN